jgi:hypothetical protein
MSINIKNKEAERLLEDIKKKTGKGTSEVMLGLLRAEHARLSDELKKQVAEDLKWLEQWRAKIEAKRRPDAPPIDEILQWDENGLPI